MSRIPERINFILSGHSKSYGGRFKRDPDARLPRIHDFPMNAMNVGQSFFMRRGECPTEYFLLIRERVRRCNKTKAAWFICEWIDNRKTLEVARIG